MLQRQYVENVNVFPVCWL